MGKLKIVHCSGELYDALLHSARYWLPRSHALNAYDDHEKLKNDLILYTKLVHNVDIQKKIVLDNAVQIASNLFNIVIRVYEGKTMKLVVPFDAQMHHFQYNLILKHHEGIFHALIEG